MAQGTILREACCSPWTLDETPDVHAELAASLAGTQRKNLLHVCAVSVASASLCNATHKISFGLFYPLLQAWDFPSELQHWVCPSALVLQKEQSLCSTDLQLRDRRQIIFVL